MVTNRPSKYGCRPSQSLWTPMPSWDGPTASTSKAMNPGAEAVKHENVGGLSSPSCTHLRFFLEMECNLATNAILREWVEGKSYGTIGQQGVFFRVLPSNDHILFNNTPAIWILLITLGGVRFLGHISTATLRFFTSGLSWNNTLGCLWSMEDTAKGIASFPVHPMSFLRWIWE